MVSVSGDGFVILADGSRRWGRYGASGILVNHTADDGTTAYFLARRSEYCHRGGTWAIPGGALNSDEQPLTGALREFAEEIGIALDGFDVMTVHEDDHGGWSYTTIVLEVSDRFPEPGPDQLTWETSEARWVTADELAELELFDAFEETLGRL